MILKPQYINIPIAIFRRCENCSWSPWSPQVFFQAVLCACWSAEYDIRPILRYGEPPIESLQSCCAKFYSLISTETLWQSRHRSRRRSTCPRRHRIFRQWGKCHLCVYCFVDSRTERSPRLFGHASRWPMAVRSPRHNAYLCQLCHNPILAINQSFSWCRYFHILFSFI